jgi:hypothetical protein
MYYIVYNNTHKYKIQRCWLLKYPAHIVTTDLKRFMCESLVPNLNLNSVNQLIFVMVKCGVLFEVRTAFLNNI